MKNRVFRCIEGRARGFVGFLMGELVAGFGAFGLGIFAGHPLVGLGVGAVLLFVLSVWRRKDADRGDYAQTWWRLSRERRGYLRPGVAWDRPRQTGGGPRGRGR